MVVPEEDGGDESLNQGRVITKRSEQEEEDEVVKPKFRISC